MHSQPAADRLALEQVRDGVFFKLPEALPRGRHKLTREQITDAQRERLLAAVTELLTARGYRGFGIGDIATRAGVSLGAFYECFGGMDECVFAGYDRFIEVLLRRMATVEVADDDRPALVARLLGRRSGRISSLYDPHNGDYVDAVLGVVRRGRGRYERWSRAVAHEVHGAQSRNTVRVPGGTSGIACGGRVSCREHG